MKTHVCIARGPDSNFILEHQHTTKFAAYTSTCVRNIGFGNGSFCESTPARVHFSLWIFLFISTCFRYTNRKKFTNNSCRLFNIHVAFFTQQANISNNICSTLTEKYVFFNYTMCGVSQIFFAFFTKRNYYTNISWIKRWPVHRQLPIKLNLFSAKAKVFLCFDRNVECSYVSVLNVMMSKYALWQHWNYCVDFCPNTCED